MHLRDLNRSDSQAKTDVTATPAPMDVGNMRSLGVRTIDLICDCGRHKEVYVDQFSGAGAVTLMTQFFRRNECGKRPKTARPGRPDRGA